MPTEVNGAIAVNTPVVVSAGYEWTQITPVVTTQEFSEDWTRENGAMVARASLEWVIAKDRLALLEPLWSLGRMRCLVQHRDQNGTTKLMGTKDEPALVLVTELVHGNGPGQGKNQYLLRATVTRRTKCPFYLPASIPQPPPVPPECPSLAMLLASTPATTINGMLSSAQQAWFATYYSGAPPCPGLADLLAGVPGENLLVLLTPEQVAALNGAIGDDLSDIDGGWPDTVYGNEVDPGGEPEPADYEVTDYSPLDYAA